MLPGNLPKQGSKMKTTLTLLEKFQNVVDKKAKIDIVSNMYMTADFPSLIQAVQ